MVKLQKERALCCVHVARSLFPRTSACAWTTPSSTPGPAVAGTLVIFIISRREEIEEGKVSVHTLCLGCLLRQGSSVSPCLGCLLSACTRTSSLRVHSCCCQCASALRQGSLVFSLCVWAAYCQCVRALRHCGFIPAVVSV